MERHASGLTTVLPADADLELRAHCAACDDGPINKPSNPPLVKDLESIGPHDTANGPVRKSGSGTSSSTPAVSNGIMDSRRTGVSVRFAGAATPQPEKRTRKRTLPRVNRPAGQQPHP